MGECTEEIEQDANGYGLMRSWQVQSDDYFDYAARQAARWARDAIGMVFDAYMAARRDGWHSATYDMALDQLTVWEKQIPPMKLPHYQYKGHDNGRGSIDHDRTLALHFLST
ncbi:hypothetical protein BDW66DRAFT_146778 [Aspergillus desertorum]